MQWAELNTARTADLGAGISSHSSGSAWNGISLQQVQGPPVGEIAEGYFLHHVLALNTRARPTTEVRLASSRWASVDASPMVLEFVPAGMPFALHWRQRSDAIAVEIEPAFVSRVLGSQMNESSLRFWSSTDEHLMTQTILALAEDVRTGSPSGRVYGECLGAALVAELARKLPPPRDRATRSQGLTPKLRRTILEYIDRNLEGDLSLHHLAGLAGMSLDGFIRVFKRSTGAPPHRYVLRKCVERAQALLGNPALSLAEIALRAGFSDQSHFSTMFHRLTGLAPRQFRQALR